MTPTFKQSGNIFVGIYEGIPFTFWKCGIGILPGNMKTQKKMYELHEVRSAIKLHLFGKEEMKERLRAGKI